MSIKVTPITLLNSNVLKSEIESEQNIFSFVDLLKLFQGRLIEQIGSHSIIVFDSLYKALLCAFEIEKAFISELDTLGISNSQLKIGLAAGVPIDFNKNLIEDRVKLADYLCFIKSDTIVVSNEVKQIFLIENTEEFFQTNKLYSISLKDEAFLIEFMRFVEKEWRNAAVKVEDFSRSLGLSKSMLYRKMILLTGKSPNNFLREYRLNRALNEINKKQKSLSEIAFESGFNSISYFSKCFKKPYGLLPSSYTKS